MDFAKRESQGGGCCEGLLVGMRNLLPQLLAMLREDGLQLAAPGALPQLKTAASLKDPPPSTGSPHPVPDRGQVTGLVCLPTLGQGDLKVISALTLPHGVS